MRLRRLFGSLELRIWFRRAIREDHCFRPDFRLIIPEEETAARLLLAGVDFSNMLASIYILLMIPLRLSRSHRALTPSPLVLVLLLSLKSNCPWSTGAVAAPDAILVESVKLVDSPLRARGACFRRGSHARVQKERWRRLVFCCPGTLIAYRPRTATLVESPAIISNVVETGDKKRQFYYLCLYLYISTTTYVYII